jgi:hypothetical protein
LKGYDAHHIIRSIGEHTTNINVIPQNYERYVTFGYHNLKYLDSFGFLTSGLDALVKNLYDEGKGTEKFKHTKQHCKKPEHLDLMLRKGVYPYDYMDSFARFEETELPPKEAFYSKLTNEGISDEKYEHAQQVWDAFECETMGDYHDLYCESDVLQLADVFENFREICLNAHGLDPVHYYTLPGYSWDAMLKKTGVELELLTDYNQHLFVESGIRGGVSMISHRHAVADNKYLRGEGRTGNAKKGDSFIQYWDANNLYGGSMVSSLPFERFKWEEERNIDALINTYAIEEDIFAVTDESYDKVTRGCFVKVDLEFPPEIHDEQNAYACAPESKLVKFNDLSPYQKGIKKKLDIGDDKVKKLIPHLEPHLGYVCDIRNLKYYKEKGLKITKVHDVLSFNQKRWMAKYINYNTTQRSKAKDEFEKSFWKLCNNACFGKTMENVRGRVQVDFICGKGRGKQDSKNQLEDRTIRKRMASPLFDGHMIYNEDLVALKSKKKEIVLNKPIYAGLAILDLSKLFMYRFHYDYVQKKYGDKATLLFGDTDSLCYLIETDDIYEDMRVDPKEFDLSNYGENPATAFIADKSNKAVLLKMKDESEGFPNKEFVGLRPKMYSLIIAGADEREKEKLTAKGIATSYKRNTLKHADYVRCIQLDATATDQRQHAKFSRFATKKHVITTVEVNKVGLCCYDNKKYILADGITSYAYGHNKIKEN